MDRLIEFDRARADGQPPSGLTRDAVILLGQARTIFSG
jgi:hypothetical protein